MNFGSGKTTESTTGLIATAAAEPPFNKAAATERPNNVATHGITIPHIAPADNPLLLFLFKIIV